MGNIILLLLLPLVIFPAYYGNHLLPHNDNDNDDGGISESCMEVYHKGGAAAVFLSSKCTNWITSSFTKLLANETLNCQFSTIQGRRHHQEDRISCNLDLKMPFLPGEAGDKEFQVGVVAVFDGHIGSQASEMASKLLLDYFLLHSMFGQPLVSRGRLQVLKQALVATIRDIDKTFGLEAFRNRLAAGTTAVVGILADGHILVANVGDSKAFLCTRTVLSHDDGSSMVRLLSKELTRDHNANILTERRRIEAYGGWFLDQYQDVPLLSGHFPMTRAIGDVPLKFFGVTADPEVTDWQQVNVNDAYLIVSSDGVFDSLSPQDVCDLLHDTQYKGNEKLKSSSSCSSHLADCIVQKAFEDGSPDNLSVILVPLNQLFVEGTRTGQFIS